MTDQVNADWTELQVTIPAADTDRAGDIAQMVVPYGIYIEDYSHLEEEAMEIAHIDLIDEDLLKKDRTKSIIHVYISPEENPAEAISFLKERFEAVGIENTITAANCAEEDWINNWKQYWHTFTIGDLYIKPTWEPLTEEMKGHAVLSIDPGTAFGTGSHETTRMVIRQLQKYIKGGEEVLDVGCGSGILSVVALKYGAKHAFGTDLDPNAIIASHENAEQNDISAAQLEVIEGNIIDDKAVQDKCGYECYDIVCANILADVLEPLSAEITQHMKHGAYFITSGIINTKEQEVVDAFKKNPELEIVEVNHDGEWVNVTARRR
mgnify:CR=1 FL=1